MQLPVWLIDALENCHILFGPHLDQSMFQLHLDCTFVGHLPQGVGKILDTEYNGQCRYVFDVGRLTFIVLIGKPYNS